MAENPPPPAPGDVNPLDFTRDTDLAIIVTYLDHHPLAVDERPEAELRGLHERAAGEHDSELTMIIKREYRREQMDGFLMQVKGPKNDHRTDALDLAGLANYLGHDPAIMDADTVRVIVEATKLPEAVVREIWRTGNGQIQTPAPAPDAGEIERQLTTLAEVIDALTTAPDPQAREQLEQRRKQLRRQVLVLAAGLPPTEQDDVLQRVKAITKTGLRALQQEARQVAQANKGKNPDPAPKPDPATPADPPLPPDKIREILGDDAPRRPIKYLYDSLELVHVGDLGPKTLFVVQCQGTYLGHTFQDLFQGPSGTGKTHVIEKGLVFMLSEDYEVIAGATGPSLKRFLDEKGETMKLLWLKETGGIAEDDAIGALIIRLISSDDKGGKFLYCGREGDNWSVEQLVLPEKLSFVTSNAGEGVNHQNLTRMWAIECESGKDHNNAVVRQAALQEIDILEKRATEFDFRARAWRQEMLPKFGVFVGKVRIPYLRALQTLFVAKASPISRHATKFRTLIEIITKLHAALDPACRVCVELEGIKYWIAEPCDYVLACEIAWAIISGTVHHLSATDQVLLKNLQDLIQAEIESEVLGGQQTLDNVESDPKYEGEGFSPLKICGTDVDSDYGRKRLKKLLQYGYVAAGKVAKNGSILKYVLDPNYDASLSGMWRDALRDVITQGKAFLQQHGKETAPIYDLVVGPDQAMKILRDMAQENHGGVSRADFQERLSVDVPDPVIADGIIQALRNAGQISISPEGVVSANDD